jgi:hypothetical protein
MAVEDRGGSSMNACRHFLPANRRQERPEPSTLGHLLLFVKTGNIQGKHLVKHVHVKGWYIFS